MNPFFSASAFYNRPLLFLYSLNSTTIVPNCFPQIISDICFEFSTVFFFARLKHIDNILEFVGFLSEWNEKQDGSYTKLIIHLNEWGKIWRSYKYYLYIFYNLRQCPGPLISKQFLQHFCSHFTFRNNYIIFVRFHYQVG